MYTEKEKTHFLKAIEAFEKRFTVISPEFEILATNRKDFAKQGCDVRGQKCYRVFGGCETPCDNCPAIEVLRGQKPSIHNNRPYDSRQPELSSCLYSYPIYGPDKALEALVMLDFDLPVLEGMEEKLQRTNSFLRNLILSSVDGVIASDKAGNILIFNDKAAEICGYTIDEALNELNIRQVYPNKGAHDVMRKLRSDDHGGRGKLESYQVDVQRKDGEIMPISLNAAIVYEGEEEVATIGFFHDLRDRLRMKAELEKTQVQLLQAEKMASLGKLAAGVAHQLNNPLGGITLFTKLVLEEYQLEDKARGDLLRILKDAERCRDTVKELLEFARQTRQEMQPRDLNQALNRTMFLLENQSLFQNIEIVKELDPALPPVPVDIQQLNHLLMNIILNAAQAMDGRGRLILKTGLAADGRHAVVEISDTGPGIPEETLPHIFEPFYTTKEEGQGTGLGLSMAYGIVQNHGGRLTPRSKPGEGTTFVIELPLELPGAAADERLD